MLGNERFDEYGSWDGKKTGLKVVLLFLNEVPLGTLLISYTSISLCES